MTVKQWEEFPIGPNNAGDELHVTLSKKGEIVIGVTAFEKLGKPEMAVLLFDRINALVGVQPTNRHAPNGYPLKSKSGCKHRTIRANRFCRHHNIKVERTISFNNAQIDEEGILILNLSQTSGIGRVIPAKT